MTTQHSLHIHARNLVQLFRQDIFPCAFLAEILQNARRARATGVSIRWLAESNILFVRDNGCGMRSFTLLTNVGQPYWDEHIMREENPAGVGFLAVILATDHITIRSRNWSIDLDSDRFLDHVPVNTKDDYKETLQGTHFALYVKNTILQAIAPRIPSQKPADTTAALRQVLVSLVKGFPIPVYFNDDLLPRPHARNGGGYFLPSEVGSFCLSGWEDCAAHNLSSFPELYCQGLPVQPRNTADAEESVPDILHLPDRTPLTLPNRDRIQDEDKLVTRIIRARCNLWRKRLLQQDARLTTEQLAHRHWDLCISLNLPDLLHQAPMVPAAIQRYKCPMTRDRHRGLTPWTNPTLPTAKDLFIYEIDPTGFDDDKPVTLATLYAASAELPVLKRTVPACHWSHQHAVDLLDPKLGMTYSINGKTRSAHFVTQRVTAKVIVCDSLTIRFHPTCSCTTHPALTALLEPRTVTQWPLYDVKCGLIIVPAAADAGPAVRQVDHYQEPKTGLFFRELCHQDQRDLTDLVDALRNNSPIAYLNSLLSRIAPDPEFIGSSPYCVQFDDERVQLVVIGQDSPPAPSGEC